MMRTSLTVWGRAEDLGAAALDQTFLYEFLFVDSTSRLFEYWFSQYKERLFLVEPSTLFMGEKSED
jgi:hypothetical protein